MTSKAFILACCLAFFSSLTIAQSVKFGIKAGADLRRIDGKPFSNAFKFGYHAGAFAEIGIGAGFSFQPEVYYSQVAVDSGSVLADIYNFDRIPSLKFGYINVPLLINFKPFKVFAIQVGPQFNMLVSDNLSIIGNTKETLKRGELSLVAGAQVYLGKIRIYGRFIQGTNNINNINDDDVWKQQSIHLGLALKF
jgi:hypothetical protein